MAGSFERSVYQVRSLLIIVKFIKLIKQIILRISNTVVADLH